MKQVKACLQQREYEGEGDTVSPIQISTALLRWMIWKDLKVKFKTKHDGSCNKNKGGWKISHLSRQTKKKALSKTHRLYRNAVCHYHNWMQVGSNPQPSLPVKNKLNILRQSKLWHTRMNIYICTDRQKTQMWGNISIALHRLCMKVNGSHHTLQELRNPANQQTHCS